MAITNKKIEMPFPLLISRFLFSAVRLSDFLICPIITNLITKENIIKKMPANKIKIRSYLMVSNP